MNLKTILFSVLLMCSLYISAQNNLVVSPTPQTMGQITGTLDIPASVRIIGKTSADVQAVSLLKTFFTESTDRKALSIIIGEKSDRDIRRYAKQIPNHPEGYYLSIEKDKIVIAGNDKRGTYYGVRTLQQLLANGKLPITEIKDYPDVPARGVVEGFYGTPWSHEDRLSLLKFFGENKLNTYIYGPKDDPYHGFGEKWRVPYPPKEAENIKHLVEVSAQNHVDFVWAIHPGRDIKWTTEDRDLLVQKFESMYRLGVRAFAVFFDDISGEGTDPEKQAELLNYVDNNFIQTKKDVLPLIMCPTEYNRSWSNIERGYLPTLGEKLNPTIQIMWTGDRVISDIDVQGLEWINQHIRRKAYIWWNFPVSDYVRDHLLMGPAYGLDNKAGNLMSGFMTNPMERAEASKVAIFSVADYAWNTAAYQPMQAWERALKAVMPNNYDAFRTFSIHNADLGPNGHGYRRDESWEFKDIATDYLKSIRSGKENAETVKAVQNEFMAMTTAAEALLRSNDNVKLIEEITPWLTQFSIQGRAGLSTTFLQEALKNGNRAQFKRLYEYITALKQEMYRIDTEENQNPYQPGVKTGSLVIEPLIDSTLMVFADQFAEKYNETLLRIANFSPHTLFTNIAQIENLPVRYLRRTISITPILEVLKVPAGGFFGIEMSPEQAISGAKINIGLDEFPSWVVVQLSKDGSSWVTYEGKANDKGEWAGSSQEEAYKFVRLLNTSNQEQECYLKSFEVRVK